MATPDQLPWQQDENALLVRIYVQPRASKSQICGIHEGELKLRLAAPPVDGAANEECRVFFAKLCKVPKSAVTLLSGETSRHKRLKIEGAATATLEALLDN